jgi:hypothetical protein
MSDEKKLPKIVFVCEKPLDDQEFERIKEVWRECADNDRPVVVSGGFKVLFLAEDGNYRLVG